MVYNGLMTSKEFARDRPSRACRNELNSKRALRYQKNKLRRVAMTKDPKDLSFKVTGIHYPKKL